MNILLVSDLAQTGFGRVGRELGTGLLAKGHSVRIIGINYRGVEGELAPIVERNLTQDTFREAVSERFAEMMDDPLTELTVPASVAINGIRHSHGHALTIPAIHGQVWRGWHADAVILVGDAESVRLRLLDTGSAISAMAADCHGCHKRGAAAPIWNYVPVEGLGIPESWRLIYRFMEPVAMSAFGQGELERILQRPVPLIPHGASTAFHPISPNEPGAYRGRVVLTKDGAKEAFGLGGRTVVLRIDRHIYRKNYAAFFRIMRPILAKRPDVVCVIHAHAQDEYGNLHDLISREPGAVNDDPDSIVGWSHPQYILTGLHDTFRGLSDTDLNTLYNAADLLVSPTMAEGFGLTLLEALACGVPVVATDYSAIPEVVGPGGIVVPYTSLITNQYAHEWALVDEPAMSAAVERLITHPAARRELGKLGRRHAARFTWSAAVDAFDALLTQTAAVAA